MSSTDSQALQDSLHELTRAIQLLDETLAQFKPVPELSAAQNKLHAEIDSAALAARLLNQRLDLLEAMVGLSAMLTASLEIDEVADEVLDAVVQITGAERAYLMLYDEKRELTLRAARNWDQQDLAEAEIGLSRSVIDAALQSREPILTTNAQADQRFQEKASVLNQKLRSIICVPLTVGEVTAGVLYADNRHRVDAFRASLLPLLGTFGTQAAIAIINAHRFRRSRAEAEALARQMKAVSVHVDRSVVQEMVAEITGADYFDELAAAAGKLRQRARGEK